MSDTIFAIARSGLDVERQRLELIARNFANAGVALDPAAEPYRPLRLVSAPGVVPADRLSGTRAIGIEARDTPPRVVRDPAHPLADAQGLVRYPGLDHAAEMALLVQTLRTYEANVVMFNAARSMYLRALDIGGQS
ncbi:flagellar basal-body rod protein FlgC [Burkholderia ubonensis]|uniref:Flagellar basal-body rod protein FlgC n=1 Tax=Burkholderia ubonensis TaxID=101571 RepID=A0ABD6Q725_9BURK|nr:flagellar basal body rod C-terminal domain-containing protein [Burkholderia ubonensis]KVC83858.1 flagellar basal-body rod protein FlgC [Burkholderia ubonensis]KVO18854.1 flagellar basal-body rod protein FlgC [Burkholderia ubonensis]KVO19559.1 flagellar basal-body rod protein FlgC [Burkholderia ubonensis]KVO33820.1 flagellar basal-body rod protein FlgC [Burkholderia ubonensis]KVP19075.1 flagellar basal-body rod protein FlgC [Burkholderia ubonensis]